MHNIDDFCDQRIVGIGHASTKAYNRYNTCRVSLKMGDVPVWRGQKVTGSDFAFVILQISVILHLEDVSKERPLISSVWLPAGLRPRDGSISGGLGIARVAVW